MAVAELVVEEHVLLGPEDHHGLVPPGPLVGPGGRLLMALHEGRVHVQGGRRLGRTPLHRGDERAVGLPEPREGGRFRRDGRLRARLPQREVVGVEGLEEVPHRRGRRQRIAEQAGEGLVLAERREVLAAVPTRDPEGDQALDELRRPQAPLARLDLQRSVDRRRDAELPEQLDHERHPRAARDQRGVNRGIDLERQPPSILGHHAPPLAGCTRWVKEANAMPPDVGPQHPLQVRDPVVRSKP